MKNAACGSRMVWTRTELWIAALLVVTLSWACGTTRSTAPVADPAADGAPAIPQVSEKRGAAYHFCGWPFTSGEADLEAMRPGLAWYYNWSSKPLDCDDGKGVGDSEALRSGAVEFVPMAWGLVDDGAGCDSGGPCFRVDERGGGETCVPICAAVNWSFDPEGECYACYHEAVSREDFLADIPENAEHLLGYNEPNFREQANLSPAAAARGWRHLEWVADQRGLYLVGPATNFCDPTPGARHAGACIEAVDGTAMLGPVWTERFYDECSGSGAAARDCRIDYQAVHAYSCDGVSWMIDLFKRKAGLLPPTEAHCSNGLRDADESNVDCGGLDCAACSEHARAMFAKPIWLTEFATPQNDCGTEVVYGLRELTATMMRKELPGFEADPYVARYAWFMPKTDLGDLDHADLLVQDEAGVLGPLGRVYFGVAGE